jgi:hypothetical protein
MKRMEYQGSMLKTGKRAAVLDLAKIYPYVTSRAGQPIAFYFDTGYPVVQ